MAITVIKKDLLQKETIRLLDKKSVLLPWANTKYQGEIKKQGDTVTVQTFPNVTLSTVTPGADITAQNATIAGENLTAGTTKGLNLPVTDLEEAISNLDLHNKIADRIAYALSDNLDQLIASHYTDAGTSLDDGDFATATNGGTGNAVILSKTNVYEAIAGMKKALSDNNAGDMAVVFINPAVTKLLVEAGYSNGSDAGFKEGKKGFVAMVAGLEVYETNNLVGTTTRHLMAFDRDSIHLAQKLTQVDVRQAQAGFRDNILCETTYGSTVFAENAKRIVTLEAKNV